MTTSHDDVARSDIVMHRDDEVRQRRLFQRGCSIQRRELTDDPVWSEITKKVELNVTRDVRSMVGEVDDRPLTDPFNRRVGRLDEALQILGKPVVTPGLSTLAIHPLLNDRRP